MGHDPQLREMESPRLDSWKEIASFLHRDARTVRRWERERRLPVHRVPGGERSGVFAYVSELESWLHTSVPAPDSLSETKNAEEAVPLASASDVGLADDPEPQPVSAFQSLNSFETEFAPTAQVRQPDRRRKLEGVLAASQIRSHVLPYQVVSLLLLLTVAIGISAAVVHFREHRVVTAAVHRPNPEAQDLYLRGRYYWNLRTEDGLNNALDLFTQSIVNDPHYAEAYAGLADAYLLLRQYGHMPDTEAYPRALAAARQAIALDDASPDAHRSIAFILRFWNWDMAAAEKEYRRAIELNPNDSLSHHWYATALLSSNRFREAMTEIDIARRLEPQSVSVMADRGLILSMMDAHAGVIALKQVEDAQPGFVSTHMYLAGAYMQMEDYEDFLAESRSAAELSHNTAMVAVLESAQKTLAMRGPKPMLRQLAGDFAPLADRGAVPAYSTARLFGLSGETGQAMRYLRLACDHREPGFLNVEDDQAFTQLRSMGEYNTLIARRDVSLGGGRQPIARLDAPELSE
jgi:tetratricopeptide (TPR) repeat protein